MTISARKLLYIAPAVVLIAGMAVLALQRTTETYTERDWPQIVKEGVLHATTEYNAVGMHVQGDTLQGLHYALINAFAQHHGLKVDISPVMGTSRQLNGLLQGDYDVIADAFPVNASEVSDSLLFTIPILRSRLVLVQRKANTNAEHNANADSTMFVRSQVDLAGRTVHVLKDSPALLRIHHLANEIGDTIYIREVERYGVEQLVAMVAHGDIDYAVADEYLARTVADSLPQIDLSTPIGFTQFYAWAVNHHSPQLLDSLNSWLKDNAPAHPAAKRH